MKQIVIEEFIVELVHKPVKYIRLYYNPPSGKLRVTASPLVPEEQVKAFLESKLGWLRKHRAGYEQIVRDRHQVYISGETHYFKGKGYLLNVIPDSDVCKIELREDRYIDLYEPPDSHPWQRMAMIEAWHRHSLQIRIPPLLVRWQSQIGVQIRSWNIRKMKSRWGSCNCTLKKISLNLELAKKGDDSLEYIIVHELMHLLEPSHNANFKLLMDQYLPDWRARKKALLHPG